MLGTTFGADEGPTLGTYDDTDLVSLEGFTDGTAGGKFDSLLLGARLELLDVINLGTEKVTELGFWYGRLLGTTLGAITTWCI